VSEITERNGDGLPDLFLGAGACSTSLLLGISSSFRLARGVYSGTFCDDVDDDSMPDLVDTNDSMIGVWLSGGPP